MRKARDLPGAGALSDGRSPSRATVQGRGGEQLGRALHRLWPGRNPASGCEVTAACP